MLDRLFLSKLSGTGKKAYWIGQISFIIAWIAILFGPMGVSLDDGGEAMLFIGIIAIVLVWGGICIGIWPKDDEDDFDSLEDSDDQVKVLKEQVRS